MLTYDATFFVRHKLKAVFKHITTGVIPVFSLKTAFYNDIILLSTYVFDGIFQSVNCRHTIAWHYWLLNCCQQGGLPLPCHNPFRPQRLPLHSWGDIHSLSHR